MKLLLFLLLVFLLELFDLLVVLEGLLVLDYFAALVGESHRLAAFPVRLLGEIHMHQSHFLEVGVLHGWTHRLLYLYRVLPARVNFHNLHLHDLVVAHHV